MILRTTPDLLSEQYSSEIEELKSVFSIEGVRTIEYLAAEPPSLFKLVGDALTWAPLIIPATEFLRQLAKNASDEVWKNRSKLLSVLGQAALKPLRVLAERITSIKSKCPRCKAYLGLPLEGEDYWASSVTLDTTDPVEAEWIISNFVLKAQAAEKLIDSLLSGGFQPLGMFQLILLSNGSWIIKWQDENGNEHEKQLD